MRNTKIKKRSFSLWTCLHHLVILRSKNKNTDLFMILPDFVALITHNLNGLLACCRLVSCFRVLYTTFDKHLCVIMIAGGNLWFIVIRTGI